MKPPLDPTALASALFSLVVLAGSASAQTKRFFATRTILGLGAPTNASDRSISMNADETIIVFDSDRAGGLGGSDLWIATRGKAGDTWGQATAIGIPINSTANDHSACLSPNGLELYFTSNRNGRDWIWASVRPSLTGSWRKPVSLGAVNAAGRSTRDPQLSQDGLLMIYASSESGNGDLYSVQRPSVGKLAWGRKKRLAGANSGAADYSPALEANGSIVWFSSRRTGGPGRGDIFLTWRESGRWKTPQLVTELSTTGEDVGVYRSSYSGFTYHNAPRAANPIVIEIECICRNGVNGTTVGRADGHVEAADTKQPSKHAAWQYPTRFVTGYSWQIGSTASMNFYDWRTSGPINNWVTAVSPSRGAPVTLPGLMVGMLELNSGSIHTFPPVSAGKNGYTSHGIPIPNTPKWIGTRLWLQTVGLATDGKLHMTEPKRITFR